jgi:hypothetical protein
MARAAGVLRWRPRFGRDCVLSDVVSCEVDLERVTGMLLRSLHCNARPMIRVEAGWFLMKVVLNRQQPVTTLCACSPPA